MEQEDKKLIIIRTENMTNKYALIERSADLVAITYVLTISFFHDTIN
jgi:hypothetical protein